MAVFLLDLIYCGRKLKDDQTLGFYGILPGSTVHVLRKSWPEPDQKPGEFGVTLGGGRSNTGQTQAGDEGDGVSSLNCCGGSWDSRSCGNTTGEELVHRFSASSSVSLWRGDVCVSFHFL